MQALASRSLSKEWRLKGTKIGWLSMVELVFNPRGVF